MSLKDKEDNQISDIFVFSVVVGAILLMLTFSTGAHASPEAIIDVEGSSIDYENGKILGQSFQVPGCYVLTSIDIHGSKGNSYTSGDFNVSVASPLIDSSDLTVSPVGGSDVPNYGGSDWFSVSFGTPIEMDASTNYYIRFGLQTPATTDDVRWDRTSASYADGSATYNNSGSWNTEGGNRMFRVWGTPCDTPTPTTTVATSTASSTALANTATAVGLWFFTTFSVAILTLAIMKML